VGIRIASPRGRVELERTRCHLFVRLPLLGEVLWNRDGVVRSSWSEVRVSLIRRAARAAARQAVLDADETVRCSRSKSTVTDADQQRIEEAHRAAQQAVWDAEDVIVRRTTDSPSVGA
jgi:hypothetical protein